MSDAHALRRRNRAMPTLTVRVSDELSHEAQDIAHQRGETLSDVLRQALAEYVDAVREEADDVRRVREIRARIATGQESLHAHEDVWAEIDALERRGALPS